MQLSNDIKHTIKAGKLQNMNLCSHCGTACITANIFLEEKIFCCAGCKLVYELLHENGLCDYYTIQSHPGLQQIKSVRYNKYAYLDSEDVARQLYKFTDGKHAVVTFYIPGIHCSSCMWLMEHMYRLNNGITESRLNFTNKEVTIHFVKEVISLREIVELLTSIGYEPLITLDDSEKKASKGFDKQKIYKIGVAGFCFGNIMMMSFPEYLSHATGIEHQYAQLFRSLNLLLSIPVFFYSASEFYISAWKGLKQKILNIDAPIVLALLITYSRSIYEIATGTGAGYLDSMSGIVFFMLAGRIVQQRTYQSISFHRDYRSYFPIAVNVLTAYGAEARNLQDLKENDVVQLHHDELIPADAIVIKGTAKIDYSFVTGESVPVDVATGEIVYAGGRQAGEQLIIQVIKPVASSYLTSLWEHHAFLKNKIKENSETSGVHLLSRYFTYILFALAALTACYWGIHDPSKILSAVSAMLIVACPCALLLSATYTNGNLMRIFSNNGLYLRDASVIEQLGRIGHIVFDKTGTLTKSGGAFTTAGHQLNAGEKKWLHNTVRHSLHPYSLALTAYLGKQEDCMKASSWQEMPGKGLEACVEGHKVKVGSASFIGIARSSAPPASVYVQIDDKVSAFYETPELRDGIPEVIAGLKDNYSMSLLSGDNDRQRHLFTTLFGGESELLFGRQPIDKLNYIEKLQQGGTGVLMIGDGLNDAGALQQSNVGITLADDVNNFTPACDAILDAGKFKLLPALLKMAKAQKQVIGGSFAVSVVYNIVGLSIAVQGAMRPMIAAILMPVSTLSIVLITTGASSLLARHFGLSLKSE
jgi:Cu+-exporting ATPase